MPTFRYAKLVRDNIPGWHREHGHMVVGRQLTGDELRNAFCQKLHEEADEVHTASSREELIEEIGDVQQIIDDLLANESITKEELASVMEEKRQRKGGFARGEYVETVTIDDENDKWAQYCRASPDKYPEIQASGHVDPDLPELAKGTYRHTKSGKLYEVTAVTFHTETNQPLVLYSPLYESKYEIFARPYQKFMEHTKINGMTQPRFVKVDE